MSLVSSATALKPAQLRELYAEHRSAVVEVLEGLSQPKAPVVDEGGRLHALALGSDVLRIFPADGGAIADERLVDFVNASYDLMVTLIEMTKRSLDVPQVPRARR